MISLWRSLSLDFLYLTWKDPYLCHLKSGQKVACSSYNLHWPQGDLEMILKPVEILFMMFETSNKVQGLQVC